MLASLRALPRDTRDTLFLLVVIAWIMLPQFDFQAAPAKPVRRRRRWALRLVVNWHIRPLDGDSRDRAYAVGDWHGDWPPLIRWAAEVNATVRHYAAEGYP